MVLEQIINGDLASVSNGSIDTAIKLAISGDVSINEFYHSTEVEADGSPKFISYSVFNAAFVSIIAELPENNDGYNKKNQFITDFLITKATDEVNEEKGYDRLALRGAVFNDYRKELLPLTFYVENERLRDYFSTTQLPCLIKVQGELKVTEEITTKEVEDVLGDVNTIEYKNIRRQYTITKGLKDLEFGSENLTEEDLKTMMAQREQTLIDLKTYHDSRKEQVSGAAATGSNFNF